MAKIMLEMVWSSFGIIEGFLVYEMIGGFRGYTGVQGETKIE